MFELGKTYRRRDLHDEYSGQRQGGISTPTTQPIIMLFVGEQGQQYGYKDEWTEDGLFLFTGEGQHGDMSFIRGNLAIRDHAANGKDLHLFEYVHTGHVRYIGQMVYTGFHERRGADVDGNERQMIVFELAPIDAFVNDTHVEEEEDVDMWQDTLTNLRDRALAATAMPRSPRERRALVRSRSKAIRVYVWRRANGICESCDAPAPFITNADRPYLEVHHIRRLSDGGPDHPRYVIAVCPNCHRHAHYSNDRVEFNNNLQNIVDNLEA